MPLERQRSLRGRDISLSSEEEEEVNDDDDDSDDEKNGDKDGQKSNLKASKNDMKSGAHKANTKNKQRTNMAMNKRKGEDSDDEDADEETSSRESSRRPSKQDIETSTSSPVNKRQKKEYAGDMKKKKDVLKQFRKLPGIRTPDQHIFIWLDLDPHLLISYIFCTFITLVQVE